MHFYTILLVLFALPLHAAEDIWQRHIVITLPQEDVFAARQQAFVKARRDAWQQLQQEIAPGHNIAMLDDALIEEMIDGISIMDEYTTASQYQATFNIAFSENAVASFLQGRQIAYSLPLPVKLIIPVYEKNDGQQLLWEEDNIWRQSLEQYDGKQSFKLPLGDIKDIQALKLSDLKKPNVSENLIQLRERYDADQAIIALFKETDGQAYISYTLYPDAEMHIVQGGNLPSAQQEFLKKINTATKPQDKTKILNVSLSLSETEKWLDKQQSFLNLPVVIGLTPTLLSVERVDMQLVITGTIEELEQQLQYLGYDIVGNKYDEGSIFMIIPFGSNIEQKDDDLFHETDYNFYRNTSPSDIKRPVRTYSTQ